MTALRPPPIKCAPSNMLDPRPQRTAAKKEVRLRCGQPATPCRPGWYRGKSQHSAHFAMLDAETSRWAGVVEEPISEASQPEFVTPLPTGPNPLDLVHIGAVCDIQVKTAVLSPRTGHGRNNKFANRSAFVYDGLNGAGDGSHLGGYAPLQRYGNPAGDWNGENNGNDGSVYQHDDLFRQFTNGVDDSNLQTSYDETGTEDPTQAIDLQSSQARLPLPTVTDVFPDFFYAYKPVKYSGYKDDCSAGYSTFSGFIRHSLDKHKRHGNSDQEGITLEKLEEAKTVKPPSRVPKKDRTRERYLLVREKLFGTSLAAPIPTCEHGSHHAIRKGRAGKRKRSGSPSNSSTAEPRGTHEMLRADFDSHLGGSTVIPRLRVSAPSQTPERPVHNDEVEDTKSARLSHMESVIAERHERLAQIIMQASRQLNVMAQNIPSGLQTAEDRARRTRLQNTIHQYIIWANDCCSRLSDLRDPEGSPNFIGLDTMQSGIPLGNTQSTSSGPQITPSGSTSDEFLSQEFPD